MNCCKNTLKKRLPNSFCSYFVLINNPQLGVIFYLKTVFIYVMKLVSIVKNIISESDKRSSIKGIFGFSDEWADKFHEINPKLSIWVASTFLEDFIKRKMSSLDDSMKTGKVDSSKSKNSVIDFLNRQGTNFITWRNEYEPEYRHIMDWVTSPRRREQINLKSLNFLEALQKSNEWHESLEGNAAFNYEEKNEVIIDYRNDDGVGFYWVDLKTDFSQEESDRMGHCGRDSGCNLFSLRSLNDIGESRSHITASYRPKEKTLREIKGKKNSKPKPVYYKYIIDLLVNNQFPIDALSKSSYRHENNFQLSDLNSDQLEYVFSKRNELKVYYLFGDKKRINVNKQDPNIILFKEEASPGYYGIANVETMEIIKNYEYSIIDDSPYTEFLSFKDKDGESRVIILKHFKSRKTGDEFIIKISNKLFEFIDKEEATKLYTTTNWDDLESWYRSKQKKGD